MKETFIAPIAAKDVPTDWIRMVRETALRDGHALRASPTYDRAPTAEEAKTGADMVRLDPCMIEVQSINQPALWGKLMLPNNGFAFATPADRDAVLRAIQEGAR